MLLLPSWSYQIAAMMMMAVAWTSFLLCYKTPSASSDGTCSNASLSYCPSGSRANRYLTLLGGTITIMAPVHMIHSSSSLGV